MSKTISGFIVIADISGYTMFLSRSELEHAQEILQSLLELLIAHTTVPLRISRLEGDAVISYAPAGSFLQGSSLLEMVDGTYVAFRQALELMVVNTTCTCNACRNISGLDLKFFVHYGTFGLQPLAAYTELVGTDVNLTHRLTKNHVKEATGLDAYALFTRSAVEALGLQGPAEEMARLTETYEHIAPVDVFVQPMAAVWERERDRARIRVRPEEAVIILEYDFPVAPVHLWDYLLKPGYRAIFNFSDRTDSSNKTEGRVGEGTVYTCAHGTRSHPQTVVDWQPFTAHTILDQVSQSLANYSTYLLSAAPEGSHLKILVGPILQGNPLKRWIANRVMAIIWRMEAPKGILALRTRMEQDIADGVIGQPEPVLIDPQEVGKSIREALGAAAGLSGSN